MTSPTRPRGRFPLTALVLTLTLVFLPGCSSRSGDAVDPIQVLRSRPSLEQAERGYLAMLDQMRTALSTAAPNLVWKTPRSAKWGGAGCEQPYSNIPDAVWGSASQTVIDVAARHGFTHVVRLADKPGHHVLDLYDDYGAQVELGTMLATTLILFGACFLDEAAHSAATAPTTSSAGA